MARTYDRAGTQFTAQASAAITAGAFSGGAQTVVDKAAAGNANGAAAVDFHINVTAAPGTAASCELWVEESGDGTNYSAEEYVAIVAVPTATGYYHLGRVYSLSQKSRAKIKAIGFGFTATLLATPEHVADA